MAFCIIPYLMFLYYPSGQKRLMQTDRASLDPPRLPIQYTSPIAVKQFCVTGGLYGQTNNQILTIGWACMLAKRLGLPVLLTYDGGDDYLHRNWYAFFGDVQDVEWGSYDNNERCGKIMTWHDLFMDMRMQRHSTPVSEWPLISPKAEVRASAGSLWEKMTQKYGSYISVHGRSFESSELCLSSSEHSPYQCSGENLCNYGLNTLIQRFQPHLGRANTSHFVLFTDGQNKEYAETYPVVERENELLVQMWMMTMSRVHIGHPASSQDYVVWRWRAMLNNPDNYMLPWQCYNN